MKAGTEDKKKLITAGVLGFCALGAVVYLFLMFFGGPPPTTAPPAAPTAVVQPLVVPQGGKVVTAAAGTPAGATAVKLGTASGELDPTLHMDGMLAAEAVVYTGTGRNVFAPGPLQATQVATVKAIAPARPGAAAPMTPVNLGPAPPPPINLKFFGVATRKGVKQALLLSGDDVFLASAGDIVARRYKIMTISANSITVQDLPNSNQQNLPLVAN